MSTSSSISTSSGAKVYLGGLALAHGEPEPAGWLAGSQPQRGRHGGMRIRLFPAYLAPHCAHHPPACLPACPRRCLPSVTLPASLLPTHECAGPAGLQLDPAFRLNMQPILDAAGNGTWDVYALEVGTAQQCSGSPCRLTLVLALLCPCGSAGRRPGSPCRADLRLPVPAQPGRSTGYLHPSPHQPNHPSTQAQPRPPARPPATPAVLCGQLRHPLRALRLLRRAGRAVHRHVVGQLRQPEPGPGVGQHRRAGRGGLGARTHTLPCPALLCPACNLPWPCPRACNQPPATAAARRVGGRVTAAGSR